MKRYIIQKWILANSAKEAIKNEKNADVDAVFLDEGYQTTQDGKLGFTTSKNKDGK